MHSWTWRVMIFGALLTVLVYTATRPDPETAGLSAATPSQLVELLGSSRDVVRRSAASRLLAQGTSSIPALTSAVPEADEELLGQIFLVLEDLYVSADEEVSDAAEEALEQLTASNEREVRQNAAQVFQSNLSRRLLRAYARIESFGGRFVNSAGSMRSGEPRSPMSIVVIPAEWTGGGTGFKYLKRIAPTLFAVHIASGAEIDEEAVRGLPSSVVIRHEDEACLGVELQEIAQHGLAIRRLVPRSPASQANLSRGDQIVEFAGRPINHYKDFINELRAHGPGEEIQAVVLRDEERVSVSIVLGSDFGTGHCRCQEDSTEPQEITSEPLEVFLPDTSQIRPRGDREFRSRHGYSHRAEGGDSRH